jgi:uncharacterized protein (DUF488 family)
MGEDSEMNAYELADRLENELNLSENLFVFDAANMLRQQADYIKHLEEGLQSSINLNKAQVDRLAELERKHKEEFDYVENLLKEKQK